MKTGEMLLEQIISVVQEPISYQDVKVLVRLGADSMLNSQTFHQIAKNDVVFEQERVQFKWAEKRYKEMNLEDWQRDIIEECFAKKDEMMYSHSTDSYIAGILDGYRILKEFGLTRE